MANVVAHQSVPLGELTASGFLSASDKAQGRLTDAIKMLTGRKKAITRAIRNADGQAKLRDIFKEWPKGIEDTRGYNVASCRGLALESEFARLANISVAIVQRAMYGDSDTKSVHGNKLVASMLYDLLPPQPGPNDKGYLVAERYVLLELLGEGGFGVAWKALDEREEQECVLKFAKDREDASYLEQELKLAKQLHHKNICAYHLIADDRDNDRAFVVMQYGGVSVARVIKGESKVPDRVMDVLISRVLRDVSAALDFIHEHETIHADINPGNILAEFKGEELLAIRLCDFGLSVRGRQQEVDGNATLAATHQGYHRCYSAPEVRLGHGVRSKSDQYSLALVIVSLAQRKMLTQPLAEAPTQLPGLTSAQIAAIARALAPDPANRFSSCGEFARAFADAAN